MRVLDKMKKPQFWVWYIVLFLVFNIAVVFDVVNVYDGKEVYLKGYLVLVFLFVFMWFLGICVPCNEESGTKVYRKDAKKIWICSISLLLLLLNILLEYVMMRYFDNTIIWFSVVVLIAVILYIGKMHHIRYWYPCSLYCTICALPGWHISDNMFAILLFSIPVFSVIEYIIMLVLNLRRQDAPKESEKSLEKAKEKPQFLVWYILLFLLFHAMAAYVAINGHNYNKEIYIKIYIIVAVFVVFLWFLGVCILCPEKPAVQAGDKDNKRLLVFILPLLLLLLDIVLYVMYYVESFTVWTLIIVCIAVLLYIGVMHHIKFWYPLSFYSCVCAISINDYVNEDFLRISFFLTLIFSVIEYIITLILNRGLWRVPKSNEK